MVQDMWPRDYGSRPGPAWETPRRASNPRSTEGRPLPDLMGPPRQSMEMIQTMREQWRIPVTRFFMATLNDNGEVQVFSGPDGVLEPSIARFFDKQQWLRETQRPTSGVTTTVAESEYSFAGEYHRHATTTTPMGYASRSVSYDRRRDSSIDGIDDEALVYRSSRKRPRQHAYRQPPDIAEDQTPAPIVAAHKGIKLDNEVDLWNFYGQRFKNCQQTACKMMAKAWIKAVEPKKQSNHPYTGSDEKAPDWWPRPQQGEKVRHKEPDHLFKRERVHLLCHILRLVMQPKHLQQSDIQKVNLNVAKLEEVTMEALNNFFGDKDNPNNSKRKPYLKEIFKIAKTEERYRNGELDGDYEVYVAADDKVAETYQSDAEDSTGVGVGVGAGVTGSSMEREREGKHSGPSSRRGVSPPRSQDTMQAPNSTDPNSSSAMAGDPYNLPVRDGQYAQQMLPPELPATSDPHGYVDVPSAASAPPPGSLHAGSGMVMQELVPPPMQEAARRSSQPFTSPTDYNASYSPANWPQGPSTTGPSASSLYTYNGHGQHAPQPPGHYVSQTPPLPLSHGQPYMPPSLEGLPRSAYDMTGQGHDLYRHNSVPQGSAVASQPHQGGYPPFLHGDGRSLATSGLKMETMGRGPL